jgi:hypothetical protein
MSLIARPKDSVQDTSVVHARHTPRRLFGNIGLMIAFDATDRTGHTDLSNPAVERPAFAAENRPAGRQWNKDARGYRDGASAG